MKKTGRDRGARSSFAEDCMTNRRMIERRNFLRAVSASVAGITLGVPGDALADAPGTVQIQQPCHGAILNRRHGKPVDGGLKISVRGQAPFGMMVKVNGIPADRAGNAFRCDLVLKEKDTDILAAGEGGWGRSEHRVRVRWDKHSFPRYRLSIDDNIFFLRDIAQKNHRSLFDCFYLDMFRKLHVKYGARFVLNVFYTSGKDFNLAQFPDRYRSQWDDNADWLKLAFHAHAEEPYRPYKFASPGVLVADLDQVAEQILRFAGERTYTPPTVLHWAEALPSARKSLANRGCRALSAICWFHDGIWDGVYGMDDARAEYLTRHDARVDYDSGIVFSHVDIMCNFTPLDKIVPTLAPLADDPNQAEIMDLFSHEQWYWPTDKRYSPDQPERLETAIRWVTEHGYKPVFFHEGMLGAPNE
jgi:hypothetical protein